MAGITPDKSPESMKRWIGEIANRRLKNSGAGRCGRSIRRSCDAPQRWL